MTYNLKAVGDDADGHELLAVVSAVHHQRVRQPLDDGALRLAKALDGISASGVRHVNWLPDLNVVATQHPSVSSTSPYTISKSF